MALQIEPDFRCYPDAVEYIVEVRENHRRQKFLAGKYPEGIEGKAFENLLSTRLFPYQKEGILFAALKYQWKSEIEKFTDSTVTVIEGLPHLRDAQYQDGCEKNGF